MQFDEDFAPGWKPEPGDVVTGKLQSVSRRDAGWGPYPILTIVQENGERIAIHANTTVLRAEVEEQRPRIGEKVGCKYIGLATPKNGGKPYHSHKFQVERLEGYDPWGPTAEIVSVQEDIPADDFAPSADVPAASTGDDDIPF